MYLIFASLSVFIFLYDLIPYKKLRRKINTGRLIDKLTNKIIKFQYKEGSTKYEEIKYKIKKAGLDLKPETYQIIKVILPIIFMNIYILFKIINYVNLSLNIEELRETARVLDNKKILDIYLDIRISIVILVGILSFFIPNAVLNIIIKARKKISEKENLILQSYTIMLLKSTKPVKQILISLYDRAKIFKPYLEYAVNRFSTDENAALEELKNSVPNESFKNICISLQKALNNDRRLSIHYLENHRKLSMEVNKQLRIRKETKDQAIGMILMILPMLIAIGIAGYPWLIFTIKSISSIPM